MSLDFYLAMPPCEHCGSNGHGVGNFNITHNLGKMADEAGIYKPLWRPHENGYAKAKHVIEPLRAGLAMLKAEPETFRKHDSPNGWGVYEHFVPFVEEVLAACEANPEADIRVSV